MPPEAKRLIPEPISLCAEMLSVLPVTLLQNGRFPIEHSNKVIRIITMNGIRKKCSARFMQCLSI